MKVTSKFVPVSQEQIQQLGTELKGVLSDAELDDFLKYVRPFEKFGSNQLDDIYLIAQVSIRGNGQITSLNPDCSVDQHEWHQVEDEPDIRIDPVSIPMKVVIPQTPFEIAGSKTFLVVLEAEGNIWDSCKDLPSWIWEEHKFEFMLVFSVTTTDGKVYYGNGGGDYANQLIEF